jgi:hypothetical protein
MRAIVVEVGSEIGQLVFKICSRPEQTGDPNTRVESCRLAFRRTDEHECSTAPHGDVEIRRLRVTHPYHPLFQQEFELVSYSRNWGEDRGAGFRTGSVACIHYNSWHDAAEDLYGVQHFLVRKRRDTHLECDAGDAAENFVHVQDLFRDRFRVPDQQCAG